ncbi:MAG: HutD family protein [Bacteroidota bacterium]
MKIYSFSQQQTKTWSGGTTTELFIFPPTSSYAERNFDFRISTATVETEHSLFTDLTGFSRYLVILEGEMLIRHENRYEKHLGTFDFDTFEGSWKTESEGKVRDFNIIYRPGLAVSVLFRQGPQDIPVKTGRHFLLSLSDELEIEGKLLEKYDLIQLECGSRIAAASSQAAFLEIVIR